MSHNATIRVNLYTTFDTALRVQTAKALSSTHFIRLLSCLILSHVTLQFYV